MIVSRATFCGAFLAKLNCKAAPGLSISSSCPRHAGMMCSVQAGPQHMHILPSPLTRARVVHFWLL